MLSIFLTTFSFCEEYKFLGFKIWGDLKFKTQYKKVDDKDGKKKSSTRIRIYFYRNLYKNFNIGFGFSTGRGYPGSYDIDVDDFFKSDSLRLNNLYLRFKSKNVDMWFGKEKGVKSIMWKFSDLLWDHDLTPVGFGGSLKLLNKHLISRNGIIFLNRKNAKRDKPYLLYLQNGISFKGFKGDITIYKGENLKGNRLLYSAHTNTLENGVLKNSYNVISFDFDFKRKFLKKIHYINFMGSYVKNLSPERENEGFLAGIWLGDDLPLEENTWKMIYMYRYLDKDSWIDTLPDSGSFHGSTGIKGSEIIFKYALFKDFDTVLDYYKLSKMSGEDLNLIQLKFLYYF